MPQSGQSRSNEHGCLEMMTIESFHAKVIYQKQCFFVMVRAGAAYRHLFQVNLVYTPPYHPVSPLPLTPPFQPPS